MIVAANFKTNKTRAQTRDYVEGLEAFLSAKGITQDVMVFPPATAFERMKTQSRIGAQNAYAAKNGAFTGEIGLEQLEEFGIDTILIGHSERRHVLGESQIDIAEKYRYFKDAGFTIVYCIGEPLEVRKLGSEALMEYLDAQLENIDLSYKKLVIAYEPVWAIGTGVTPTNGDITLIHGALRRLCSCPLLYGGSVKADNAMEIMAIDNVDGVLVGSGALKLEDFCSMIESAQNLGNKE